MSPLGGSEVGPQLDTWQSITSGAHQQHQQPFDGQESALDSLMSEVRLPGCGMFPQQRSLPVLLRHATAPVDIVSTAALLTHRTTSSSFWACRCNLLQTPRHDNLSSTIVLPLALLSHSSSGPVHQESLMR
jgi:hypothetical protein